MGRPVSVENNIVTIRSGPNKVVLYSDGYALLVNIMETYLKTLILILVIPIRILRLAVLKPKDIVFYVYQENNNNTIQQLTK